jgi:hypothetical protein
MRKKLNVTAAVIALFAFISSPALAVNKCSIDGKTVFQDAACPGKGETLVVRPASGQAQPAAANAAALKAKGEVAALNRRAEVRAAIERREPLIGMTQAELLEAMGQPDRANTANYNGVPHNQLIYERGGRTLYVYTDAGVVKAIQNTESAGGVRRVTVRCPSPMEIRSMETSASSITLSEAERVERLRQIGEARKCAH